MRLLLANVLVTVLFAGCGDGVPSEYQPRHGDVIFQSLPASPLVQAIEGATRSPFSHCGLVLQRGDSFLVLEAFHVVHETPLGAWIRRGRAGAFSVFRLRSPWSAKIEDVIAEALRFTGRPYDMHYAFDDDAIYCSELVFKAFKAATGESLGVTQRLGDLHWRPFEDFIKGLEGSVPLDREMITPKMLSEAAQLEEVLKIGR